MAITKGAKKAIRSQERKRVYNLRRKRTMAGAIKGAIRAAPEDRTARSAALSAAYKAIDKAAKSGTIKKNTAARKKSRLSKRLKASSEK